jgi:hypothetical protein
VILGRNSEINKLVFSMEANCRMTFFQSKLPWNNGDDRIVTCREVPLRKKFPCLHASHPCLVRCWIKTWNFSFFPIL